MDRSEIALARTLSDVIRALYAVHLECVAFKTEGMATQDFLEHIDKASEALSSSLDSFNHYVATLQGDQNG